MMPGDRYNFFGAAIIREIPRLLSSLDRCPVSATRGSFDREYWAWATKDFSNMDLQRALYPLAYAYAHSFPGNHYFREASLLEWIKLGVDFWMGRQDRWGTFDHLYVHEKSWMAAAFTLSDLVPTFSLVKAHFPQEFQTAWMKAMIRAGEALCNRDELHGFISNHRLGAAAGLLSLAALTGRSDFSQRAKHLIEEVIARQSPEGWFLEYEGFDPGYQTLATHYLGRVYLAHPDPVILEATKRSLDCLSFFVHPDWSLGGEYGSRGCPHVFPGGLEVFARHLPVAETLAKAGAQGLSTGATSGLDDSDTRNTVPLLTSYVLAHNILADRQNAETADQQVFFEQLGERILPQAGMGVFSLEKVFLIFGAAKGGVVKLFRKSSPRLLFSSCGYTLETLDGVHGTTLLWTSSPCLVVEQSSDPASPFPRRLKVDTPFFKFLPDRTMNPLKLILFRLFNLTIGRWPQLNDFVRKELIIKRFLKSRIPLPVHLSRELVIERDSLTINDEISLVGQVPLSRLQEHGFFSSVYMASARYFRSQDLNQAWSSENLVQSASNTPLVRTRSISFYE